MTGTGKTRWVGKVIEHLENLISPVPDRIILCYGAWQAAYSELKRKDGGPPR
jgi:hypothetical protein